MKKGSFVNKLLFDITDAKAMRAKPNQNTTTQIMRLQRVTRTRWHRKPGMDRLHSPFGRSFSTSTPVSTVQQRATFCFVYPPPPVTCPRGSTEGTFHYAQAIQTGTLSRNEMKEKEKELLQWDHFKLSPCELRTIPQGDHLPR